MRGKLIIIVPVLLLIADVAESRSFGYDEPVRFYLGLNIGPVLAWDDDFNGENTRSKVGFDIGAETINSFGCHSCRNIMLETGLYYEHLGRYTFRPIRVRSTSTVGSFRESLYILHGNCGLRYYLIKGRKLSPFISFTPGVYYTKIKSTSFRDFTGKPLDAGGLARSSINFGFGMGLGLSYNLSYKIVLEFYPKWHIFFPQGPNNSFIQFPLTFKYRF